MATTQISGVGELLRAWRQRRNLSQLELSLESAISTRHLSFVETGRAKPSREMVLHLANRLEVPLRERNNMLLAAGFAPVYGERPLDDTDMTPVREALDRFLHAHEPYPAVVLDGRWNLAMANGALGLLTDGVAPELLQPPANALRVSLHPDGMAPRIGNLAEWSAHLLHRLRRRIADHRGLRARTALRGTEGLSRRAAGATTRRHVSCRHRAPAPLPAPPRGADVPEHDLDLRYSQRHHPG